METRSRGYRIHYITQGDGEPLVMIPGLMMSASRWVDLGFVDAFSDRFRVIAVDPLGHGLSDKPYETDSYRGLNVIADIVAVLDAERIDTAHIWGYSRGSTIAVGLASRVPARVRSLIVGGGFIRPGPEMTASQADAVRARAQALREGNWEPLFQSLALNDPDTEERFKRTNDPQAIAAVLEGRRMDSISIELSALRGRMLVYLGSEEPALKVPGALDGLREYCRSAGARLEIIEGCGHAKAFQAASIVAPLVGGFLASLSSPSPTPA